MDVFALWRSVCSKLSSEYGEDVFKSWISPLSVELRHGTVLSIIAPNKFLLDWVSNNYASDIKDAVNSETSEIEEIEFRLKSENDSDNYKQSELDIQSDLDDQNSVVSSFNAELAGMLDPRLTFENFVVGKSNEFAYAAAMRVAESDTAEFNPLFIYGGVGLGKTHLLNAIAWHIIHTKPDRKVIYLSAEKFMYEFIKAVRFKNTMDFKEQFRSVDVLMIDDIQFICGKESTQEEFFHTFNALVDKNRQVIISADSSPSDLDGMEERMKSRLGWGLVADVHPTNYELRLGILQHKASTLDYQVPKRVLEFIAQKVTSNVRELEGALNRVVAKAMLTHKEITLEMTTDILSDIIRANDRKVTVEDIQKKVAEHFSIRISDMYSDKRSKNIARPRQIAMYLSKKLTTLSLPDIGRKFGGRDHTTVIHAVKKVEELISTDISFDEDIKILTKAIS